MYVYVFVLVCFGVFEYHGAFDEDVSMRVKFNKSDFCGHVRRQHSEKLPD